MAKDFHGGCLMLSLCLKGRSNPFIFNRVQLASWYKGTKN